MDIHRREARLEATAVLCALAASLFTALPSQAGERQQSKGLGGEEFFIISSVDLKKNEMVLKRPTEVTELVRVGDQSVYLDANGKPLRFQDLRAGDTVYVTFAGSPDGPAIARRIRKGPMTAEELRRRYLSSMGKHD